MFAKFTTGTIGTLQALAGVRKSHPHGNSQTGKQNNKGRCYLHSGKIRKPYNSQCYVDYVVKLIIFQEHHVPKH